MDGEGEEENRSGSGEEERDDRSEMVVALFISPGMTVSCGNIGGKEPRVCFADLDFELGFVVRISDTLFAREHRASESIPAKAFRLKILD